jgi:hypothetical protein
MENDFINCINQINAAMNKLVFECPIYHVITRISKSSYSAEVYIRSIGIEFVCIYAKDKDYKEKSAKFIADILTLIES